MKAWPWRDPDGLLLKVTQRFPKPDGGKDIIPYTLWEIYENKYEWRPTDLPEPRPLYGLDRLARRPDAPVILCEGEKACDAAEKLFPDHVAVSSGSCNSCKKADWTPLQGRTVIAWPDHDDDGLVYVQAVQALTMNIVTSFATVQVPHEFLEKWDLADPLPEGWAIDRLRSLLEPGPTVSEGESTQSVVGRLAELSVLEYDQIRNAEADRLGVRVGTLDEAVGDERRRREEGSAMRTMFPVVEPWPNPVDAAVLLDEITATVKQFIVCDPEVATAVSLWAAFTWVIDHVQVAPIAQITAPEKRCGKTQLLDLIHRISRRPLMASNISPAAVYRVIEAHCPTLCIDEADSFLKDNEPLRGVIDSGHTRQAAFVVRTTGDDHEPCQFSTWGAKAISGIGHLSATLMDRSIVLSLRRKLPDEQVRRLRHAEMDLFPTLAAKLARFAEDAGSTIGRARPDLPDALHDRAQDNWEPLLAIADYAGGEWPSRARACALKLSDKNEAHSRSTELLADIQAAFESTGRDQAQDRVISTADLIHTLTEDDTKPWATFLRGNAINPRQLADRLKEFGISSMSIKTPGGVTQRGYRLSHFQDTFNRYLPSPEHFQKNDLSAATFSQLSSNHAVLQVAAEVAAEVAVAAPSATCYLSATSKPAPMLSVAAVAAKEEGVVEEVF